MTSRIEMSVITGRPSSPTARASRRRERRPIPAPMPARRAGQHARAVVDARRRRILSALVVLFVADAVVAVVTRFDPIAIIAASAITIAAEKLLERFALPTLERWSRGAAGEESVGGVLD